MSVEPAVIYDELLAVKVELDFEDDPRPSTLQDKIIECNGAMRKVEKRMIQVTRELAGREKDLKIEEARLEVKKRHVRGEVKEDNHELKASEEEARRQRRTAEGIIYGSPTPMFVIDKDHKIIYWNKACENLTGFSREEMIGTQRQWEPFYRHSRPLLADVIVDDDPDQIEKTVKKMGLHRSPVVEEGYEAEYFVPHLGEEGTHLYLNAAPIKDDKGSIQGAIITYQDFSERVKMTRHLKASEE